MTDYKRITRRNEDGTTWVKCVRCENVDICDYTKESCCQVLQDRLAELEDMIEQGLLVKLPCKVGDKVYQTDCVRIYQGEILSINIEKNITIFYADIICFDERAIGKTVFLTKAEAEARLAELRGVK